MVHNERIEIIKLFISVFAGFAVAGAAGNIFDDPLSTILVSAAAVIIIYYILGYAESLLVKKRNRND